MTAKKKNIKKSKNLTIEDLALMVQRGFAEINSRFDGLEDRMDKLEVRMEGVEANLATIMELEVGRTRKDYNELERKVSKLEQKVFNKKD